MTIGIGAGVAAYADAVKKLGVGGTGADGAAGAANGSGGFAQYLKGALGDAVETERKGEAASIQAATGKSDINAVVAAVTDAEVTLQTVVAVRDKVVQAYQQILQMPV